MQSRHKYTQKSREGWAEMIRQEVEKNGQPELLIPDFFEDNDNDWTW